MTSVIIFLQFLVLLMTPLIRIVQRKTSVLAVVFSGLSNFDFKKQDHKQFDISRLVLNVELSFG